VVSGQRPDTLILLEHEAVYTAGKRTEPQERPTDGTPVIDVDRGGKITWHGPGQLVGYPIVRLPEPVDVVAHVRRLERLLIDALGEHGVDGYRVEGRSGVWVRRPLSEDKIAAIGVRVEKGVTMHGFAVNCDNTLAGFNGIIPCGITDAGVTTVSEVVGRDVGPADIVDSIVSAFEAEYSAVLT
jgi:lipoyl(octanoyl) transferase